MTVASMLVRQAALARTLDRFATKPFDWSKGATCVHLVRFHLAQMGHAVPPMPRFRTPLGATRALKAKGWLNLVEMMDALLPAIPPAMRLPGDIVALPTEGPLGAVGVAHDNGRVLGYMDGYDALVVAQPHAEFVGAWRA